MSFADLINRRYSVRDFAPLQVEEDKLRAVLEAGRLAPTAANKQPQRFYVAKSEESLSALREITPCVFNAPVVIILAAQTDSAWVNPFSGRTSAETDVTIAGTQMMLQAAELGLGTTWVQWADLSKIKAALALPDDITVYGLLNIGYPSESAGPAPLHTQRKPLEETVHTI